MNTAFRIEIRPTINDSRSRVFLEKIQAHFPHVHGLLVSDVYTVNKEFSGADQAKIGAMLSNPIIEEANPESSPQFDFALETGFLPGVTDNVGRTVIESIEDLFKLTFNVPTENVYASQLFYLSGVSSAEEAQAIGELFTNKLINRIHVRSADEYKSKGGMDTIVPKVELHHQASVDLVDLDVDDDELEAIGKKGIKNADGSRRGPLALRMSYLKTIQEYFRKQGRKATDIELEALAQTWSEHCKHTIFADPFEDAKKGLFKYYIKRATEDIRKAKGKGDFCISVFTDNSGGIIFDDDYMVSDKAETHNSPSALDPFGGAITGIVGVNRDALGFGMGSKPVINRYGYCFGNPDQDPKLYRKPNREEPMLHPRTILDGVIKGVNNGGNESGIPSPQGFMYFDERYNGKPLVFVGTVGLIPRIVNGKNSAEKAALAGDRIIVAGGRVGLDGIHGATFSSEALDTGSPSTAVQIGDPITQKKLSDVIVKELRDAGLYNSITDNGAGGISCSIAEMAKECGGCEVQLENVPLKYPNLAPWEIWISESQERMTFAVPPEKVETLMKIMQKRGVEAWDVGEFTDSGRCIVKHNGDTIFDLEMDFLHEGLPAEPIQGVYKKPQLEEPTFEEPENLTASLLDMLKRKNMSSFRFVSKQYDHEVQGGSVIKPSQGPGLVNGTASVTRPLLTSEKAVVISQGLNPRYSDIDTYAMAAASIDDAIAAAVAAGANVDHMAIMDNFCWCSSNDEQRLGELKAAAEACYDLAVAFGTPYISGKDSMFNDFSGYDEDSNPIKVSIPPTLLVSALSVIPDASNAMSLDFKNNGDAIYLIGETKAELGGSEYYDSHGALGNSIPQVDAVSALARYRKLYEASQANLLNSAIHLDRGGLGIALLKSSIAGQLGASIALSAANFDGHRNDHLLFSESKSRFLVSVAPGFTDEFEALFPTAQKLGHVGGEQIQIEALNGTDLIQVPLAEATEAYHSTFKNY